MKFCVVGYSVVTEGNGHQFVSDKFGRLLDELAPHFEHIDYLVAQPPRDDMTYYPDGRSVHTYEVSAPNVRVVGVAASDSRSHPLSKLAVWVRRIRPYATHIRQADFVYIAMPGFSGFLAHITARISGRPYCLYFGSDWQEITPFMADWTGLAALLRGVYAWLATYAERIAVRHSAFTIVHGRRLMDRFQTQRRPIFETVPMVTIRRNHFHTRADTCKDSAITCLYVGALIPRKNVSTLVDAFGMLLERGLQARLLIVGAGDHEYTSGLQDRVRALGLQNAVTFTGQVSDLNQLIAYYRDADVFVLPSLGEGFPRVIYEAMSQGLPVVASSIDTVAAVLEHGKHAFLVRPVTAETLAQAIHRVTTDGEMRRTLIRNGYRFALERIGQEETSARQLLRLIRQYNKNDAHATRLRVT